MLFLSKSAFLAARRATLMVACVTLCGIRIFPEVCREVSPPSSATPCHAAQHGSHVLLSLLIM